MVSRRRGLTVAAVVGLASLAASSGTADAQTKDAGAQKLACVQASDKAQQLRVAGKLVAARSTLQTCVLDACPAVVREACSQWMGEVNASLPSIVIGAKDADGKDILDIKVLIDGEPVTEILGGRAIPIDPGRHKMHYEKTDGTVVEEDILVGEGTKNRAVSVMFPGASKPAGAVAAVAPPSDTHKGASTANTAVGATLAVVGAGALATALALDLVTNSNVNAAKNGCGKNASCNSSTVSGYELDYDLAGVALGVGVVAVGLATYIFIAHPLGTVAADPARAQAARPWFRVVPSPHGGGLALTF
jgi:hypothetical protein